MLSFSDAILPIHVPHLSPASISPALNESTAAHLDFPAPPNPDLQRSPCVFVLSLSGYDKQGPEIEDGPDILLFNPRKILEFTFIFF